MLQKIVYVAANNRGCAKSPNSVLDILSSESNFSNILKGPSMIFIPQFQYTSMGKHIRSHSIFSQCQIATAKPFCHGIFLPQQIAMDKLMSLAKICHDSFCLISSNAYTYTYIYICSIITSGCKENNNHILIHEPKHEPEKYTAIDTYKIPKPVHPFLN